MRPLPKFLAKGQLAAGSSRGKPLDLESQAMQCPRLTVLSPLYNPPQEQNRPVYVQAVEPRAERQPLYPIPDGRHFVVVD